MYNDDDKKVNTQCWVNLYGESMLYRSIRRDKQTYLSYDVMLVHKLY
jgi:hypothetical protein